MKHNRTENVQFLPPVKRYMNAVERRLQLPLKLKVRVMNDFATSFIARREQGETDAEIMAALGTPVQAAKCLNEQMKEYTFRKSPWRFAFLALALLSLLWLAGFALFTHSFPPVNAGVGIIGGADGPTSIILTSSPAGIWPAITAAFLAAVGLVGFFRLRRCRRR